jgi:ribosome recycling factor
MDAAKKTQKDGKMSEDELRDTEGEVQKLTDRFVADIDKHTTAKEAELMKI